MKLSKRQLKRIIREEYTRLKRRGLIREFGENDAQLRQKLQNRERMIGIGMDGGALPFNPNWDYDKKTGVSQKPRGYISDELSQVKYVIEENDMHSWLEVVPTSNPDKIYLVSGGLKVIVTNDWGDFKFVLSQPREWKWKMECESRDSEIDNVLYELSEYVNEMEGNV